MTLKKSIWKKLGLLALVVAVMFTFAACDNGSVTDETSEYDVNFTVQNEDEVAVADATIEMDETTETTTENGTAQFTVNNGDYDYTVSAEGYQEATGSVAVNGEDVSEPVTLTAVQEELTVSEVSAINDINVEYDTNFADIGFPETVEVTLSDDSTADVPVSNWDAKGEYDDKNSGSYDFVGTLDVSDKDFTNPGEVKAEVTVIVGQEDRTEIVSVESLNDVEVEYNTPVEEVKDALPSQVTATLANGNDVSNVPVEWDTSNYVADSRGTYTLTGALDVSNFDNIANTDVVEATIDVVVEKAVLNETVTGELKKIYEGGSRITLDSSTHGMLELPVAAETQLGRYLSQLDEEAFVDASNFTVEVEDDMVTELTKVELTGGPYDYIAFNTLLNGQGNGVTGVEIVGQSSTTAVTSVSADSGVTGTTVDVLMNRVILDNIQFDVDTVNVGGDDIGEYATIKNSSVVASTELNIKSYDSDIQLDSTVTLVKINDEQVKLTTPEIDGDLTIKDGAIDSDINVGNITGSVTLNETADLTNIDTVEGSLEIGANDVTIDGIDVDGTLTINAKDADVTNSTFGELSGSNEGINATLDTVTFDKMYKSLYEEEDVQVDAVTELTDGDTFTVNLAGWSFKDMDWPVENLDTVHVDVAANSVSFENATISGELTFTDDAEEASFTNVDFEDTINLANADNTATTAPTFTGGEMQYEITNIVANTSFDGVTFDIDSSDTPSDVVVDVDGVSFTGTTFKDTVHVDVDTPGSDAETTFTDVVFEESSSINANATTDSESLITIDGATFGGKVVTTFAGAGRIDVVDAEFAYDSTAVAAAQKIDIDDDAAGLSIYFDNNTIYRNVIVTDVNTARFRDGTTLYRDFDHDLGDVRLIDSVFDSTDNTIEVNTASGDQLSVNGVDFTGAEDIYLNTDGTGTVKFIGTTNGGDVLEVGETVDTDLYVNVTTQSVVNDVVFAASAGETADLTTDHATFTFDVEDEVEFDGVTFENGLYTDAADLTLRDVESSEDLFLLGSDAVLGSVTTDTADINILAAGADLTDVTVDGILFIGQSTFGETLRGFTNGTTTLDSVDAVDSIIYTEEDLDATDVFDVNWTEGTVETVFDIEVNADTNSAESTLTFNSVDFTTTTGGNFDINSAANDVVNINEGSIAFDTMDTLIADNVVTFDGVTFTADQSDIHYVATFKNNTFEGAVNDVSAPATFESNTFEGTLDDVSEDVTAGGATFEDNTFEDAVTLTTNTAASFDGDKFQAALDISNTDVSLANIVNEIAASDTTINVNESVVIDGWTLKETGSGVLEAVVASDKVLTLENDIDWSDAPEFSIDAQASGANVNDDEANWIPEKAEIK